MSPQNVSIVRDRGTGLRSISTSDSLHFHFNWHLDYQRFNFISVNIKTDSVRLSLSLSRQNISADDHNFNGKLILCYLICVQKLEFPLQYFIWVEHKMSIKRPWLWHIMTYTFQRNLKIQPTNRFENVAVAGSSKRTLHYLLKNLEELLFYLLVRHGPKIKSPDRGKSPSVKSYVS